MCGALVSRHGFKNDVYYMCNALVSRHWHITCVARFTWLGFKKRNPYYLCGTFFSRHGFIIMKSYILDPLPATILKQHFDLLLPIILKIVNLSVKYGHFPSLKFADLSPLLKKANLDHEVNAKYRPILNIKVISKIIEKVVVVRLQKYLEANQLNEPLQSAYKPLHSCKTAIVRVHNDILVATDKRYCVILLLLELSAAFDTVDHGSLLTRLHSNYSISTLLIAHNLR